MEQKSNKKRNLLIILVLIIVIIIGFFIYKFYENRNYSDELSKDDKRILIESSYSNYASIAQFSGTAIFNDGTIYSWDSISNKKENGNYNINSADGLKSYILENGKKRLKRVTSKDIEKIENYINNLEDTIDIEYPGADQGTNSISVWNTDDQKITLSLKGDSVGENKSEIAQELLKLIDKYL